jgi:hypothetical protein
MAINTPVRFATIRFATMVFRSPYPKATSSAHNAWVITKYMLYMPEAGDGPIMAKGPSGIVKYDAMAVVTVSHATKP